MKIFSNLEILPRIGEYIEPFLWIFHIFRWRLFFLMYLEDHIIHIDFFTPLHERLIYDIYYFLSGEFFVLGSLRDEALVCLSTDIEVHIFFISISQCDATIESLERLDIRIRLEILIFIKSYKIELVEDRSDEYDENVYEFCSQEKYMLTCNNGFEHYNIRKEEFFNEKSFRLLQSKYVSRLVN